VKKIFKFMLPLLLNFLLGQTTPAMPPPEEVVQPQEVRPLPGQLDTVPMFNSNSPELVLEEGILLSTFPPDGKKVPTAHLNFPFRGRFDVFAHHVAKAEPPENLRPLYLGIILYNPGSELVKVNILQAASYLSQPDAPFIELPSFSQNILGKVFAGPGDRAMSDILRGKRQEIFPAQIEIPPGQSRMLLNLPIPVQGLTPPLNGRSTLIRLWSNGTVYAASLAMFARVNPDGSERGLRQPVRVASPTGEAGTPTNEEIISCTILTTAANELLQPIHERMPVILEPQDYDLWLDSQVQTPQTLQQLLRPYPAPAMTAYPVSTLVNNSRHNSSECIMPLSQKNAPANQLN